MKTARAVRQPQRRAFPQSIRQHAAPGEHAREPDRDSRFRNPAQWKHGFRLSDPKQQGRDADREVRHLRQRPHVGSGSASGRRSGQQQFEKLQNGSQISISKVKLPSTSSDSEGQRPMNPSRPFILRPVATSLLMAAILLVGIVAFMQLPVSALPEVDYPTIQVLTFYPGASPDVVATTVTAPLERQFGEMQGLSQMTSTSAGGVRSSCCSSISTLEHRRCRRGSPVRDERIADLSALRPAHAAGLQQDQSRRRARPHPRRYFRFHAAFPGGGPGGYAPGSARSPSSPASAWSPSAAARSPRSASRLIQSRFPLTASTWRTSAPPWSRPA